MMSNNVVIVFQGKYFAVSTATTDVAGSKYSLQETEDILLTHLRARITKYAFIFHLRLK